MLLALVASLLMPSFAHASLTCGCEWSPWTRTTYLNCAEVGASGETKRVVSQQPFQNTNDCEAAASRGGDVEPARSPAAALSAESVDCECEWNPWKSNYLLSCTALKGREPSVRILDRMPFGAPKGRKGEAERSCMAAKSRIENQVTARSSNAESSPERSPR